MYSEFCVEVVILHLHKHSVYGQSLIKKQNYWPKGCPGAHIDSYMEGKPFGFFENLRQNMGGVPFNIHCTIDYRFVTKLVRTHGLIKEVPDHSTHRQKDG